MKATDFLRNGADLLEERGKQYDQPGGERSMGKTVRAFNAITGRDLTEPEGWLLLQVLKDVRQWQNPDKYHADSAEDCVSYAALKAEALLAADTIRAGWTPEAIKDAAFNQHHTADYTDPHDDFGTPLPLRDGVNVDPMGEWIEWAGGECPVKDGADVSVKWRCDETGRDTYPEGWEGWIHDESDPENDIIAYKIHRDA
jgi:hypothetical protein